MSFLETETSTKSPAVHDDAKISDEAPSTDEVLLTSASFEVEGSGNDQALNFTLFFFNLKDKFR